MIIAGRRQMHARGVGGWVGGLVGYGEGLLGPDKAHMRRRERSAARRARTWATIVLP